MAEAPLIAWGLLAASALAAPSSPGSTSGTLPDRGWDFEHLDLWLRVRVDDHEIEGRAVHTVRYLGGSDAESAVLRLDQVGLQIRQVRVDGVPSERWQTSGPWLEIPVPLAGDARHEVAVEYTAEPQTGLHFREEAGQVWSQGEPEDSRHWVPCWDRPDDRLTVRTTIEAPAGLSAVANGTLRERRVLDDGAVAWTYALDRPIPSYLLAVAVGRFEVYADEAVGSPERFESWVAEGVGEAAARRTFDRVQRQVPFFEELLGEPFPYPIYRQIAVRGFLFGAMENATSTFVDDRRLLGAGAASEARIDEMIAHELAHQWFGDLLTCYGWRQLWLNEGFATYYAGRWQAHDRGPEREAELVLRWLDAARRAPRGSMIPTSRSPAPQAAIYGRGAAVLHSLRVLLGDEAFDAGIRLYVARHRDGFVDTDQLRRALEEASGRYLDAWFDRWVTGEGAARWLVEHHFRDGQLEIAFEQPRGSGAAALVELEIGLGSGERALERAWLGPGRTSVTIPLRQAPRYVAVDPRGGVIAEWEQRQTTAEWAAQAEEAAAPLARIVAIRALGAGSSDPAAREVLAGIAARTDAALPLRRAALAALGATGSGEALPALLSAVADPDPALAIAAIEAIAVLQPDGEPAAAAALGRAARSGSTEVAAAAMRALAVAAPVEARRLAHRWLARSDPSFGQRRWVAAAEVLGATGGDRDLAALIERIDPAIGDSAALVAAGASATLLAAGREPEERLRSSLVRAIEPLLDSPDLRVRQAAIRWLGRVGDPRSQRMLLAFAERNRVSSPDLGSAARDAARRIREGRTRTPEPPSGRASEELARLQRELLALEGRIEELDAP